MRVYALNISMVFSGLPFLDRLDAAAAAGFAAVEFWWPREEFAAGLTPQELVARVRAAKVDVALMNLDGGDFTAGERGLAGVPERAEAFLRGLPHAFDLAGHLGCHRLNALAGRRVAGEVLADQLRLLESSVAAAADLAGSDTMITLEALNPTELPGYLLPDSCAALAVIDRIDRPNVGFQLDAYHLVMAGEDVVEAVGRAGGRIGHVQFADVPGRHEPGTGSLPFPDVLRALTAAGYRSTIGLEYVPSQPDAPDFSFVQALRRAEAA